MKVQIAGVLESLNNTKGVSKDIFFSGCSIKCQGCSNPDLWDSSYGSNIESEDLIKLLEENIDWCDYICYLGGEPTDQIDAVIEIAKWAHSKGKKNWIYTGHIISSLRCDLKDLMDVIVDGPFKINEVTDLLPFRGSQNQKLYYNVDGKWVNEHEYNKGEQNAEKNN